MRFPSSLTLGVLLLVPVMFPETSAAENLAVPDRPPAISPYVQAVFTRIEGMLAVSPVDEEGVTCDAATSAARAARTAESFRGLLRDASAAIAEPAKDLARTACFRSDAEALERYLRGLFDRALESAGKCQTEAELRYSQAAAEVWRSLLILRHAGLDPATFAPVIVGEEEIPSEPSSDAEPPDDDALCPYHSAYAEPTFQNFGCMLSQLPSGTSPRLIEEARLTDRILRRPDRHAFLLQWFRETLVNLWQDAATYVGFVSVRRLPGPPVLRETFLSLPPSSPLAESGCEGWPSERGGTIPAPGAPLEEYFPIVLTRELAEVVAFLREREGEVWLEEVRAVERAGTGLTLGIHRDTLFAANRLHLAVESFGILTVRDAQRRLANLGDMLHARTRDFARVAVALPDDPLSPAPGGPPLRAFARRFAGFLAGMCVNRGCNEALVRTIELSRRDDCYSSFLEDLVFRENPGASTLPPCRAITQGAGL